MTLTTQDEKVGGEFNLNSPKQLGEILFDQLQIDPNPKRTRTGQYMTNEQQLSRYADRHPMIPMLLNYRVVQKLKSTYVDTLPAAVFDFTGRIHTTFNQLVASTGRLNSEGPNLQNIPIRTDKGREIRRAFVPRGPDYLLLSADYSQIELRARMLTFMPPRRRGYTAWRLKRSRWRCAVSQRWSTMGLLTVCRHSGWHSGCVSHARKRPRSSSVISPNTRKYAAIWTRRSHLRTAVSMCRP